MRHHTAWRRVCVVIGAAAIAMMLGAVSGTPDARAATLHIAVMPLQHMPTSVVKVVATGSVDPAPAQCPAGIGCELTVFVIRGAACPPQPAPLLGDPDVVLFLTNDGLPALVGTMPGPFTVSSDYFLDGAPTAAGQGNTQEGYTRSAWGTFSFCGYLGDATAAASFTNAPPDQLSPAGPPQVRLGRGTLSVYSVTCAVPPCRIVLRERAFARGRHLAGLDSPETPPLLDNGTPAGGFPVSFPVQGPFRAALTRAVARYGAVTLRFTATVTDAGGGHATAPRLVIVTR